MAPGRVMFIHMHYLTLFFMHDRCAAASLRQSRWLCGTVTSSPPLFLLPMASS